jgi:flagellar protein FlaG
MVMNVSNAAIDTAAGGRGLPSCTTSAVSGVPKRQGVAAGGQQQDQGSGTDSDQASGTSIKAAVTRLNDFVQNVQRNLEFKIDDATGCTVVTVRDAQTDEVIRQIPPEQILKIMQQLADHGQGETTVGLLLRENA